MLPLLGVLNLGLLGWLLLLWLTPQGEWVGIRWQPPAALSPTVDSGNPLPVTDINLGRYVATLERPLFVISRRPPPPPPVTTTPPVDPFPNVRLMAIYGNAEVGGIVAAIDGRLRRLKLGDAVNGFALKNLQSGSVQLARGDDVRTIELKRSNGTEPPVAVAGGDAAPPRQSAAAQSELDERRRAALRRNERRARSGLPPLPIP